MRRRRSGAGRKLLVASVGVAAVTYVACSSDDGSSNPPTDAGSQMDVVANLVAPDTGTGGTGQDASQDVNQLDVVANLVAPDTGTDAPDDSTSNPLDVVANLVAPDTGTD